MAGYKELYTMASFFRERLESDPDISGLTVEVVPDDYKIEIDVTYMPIVTLDKISCAVKIRKNTDNVKKTSGDGN
jgi:hypothetical protein